MCCVICVYQRSSAANYCLHSFHRVAAGEIGGAFRLDLREKEIQTPEWIKQEMAADERRKT
jgi:hypothetical protein